MKKIKFRIQPIALVWLACMLMTDYGGIAHMSILAALVHECGHMIAARLMRIPLSQLRLDLLGARLDVQGKLLSYGEEWLLCAAGPLTSMLASLVAACFWHRFSTAVIFSCASFLLGCLNLLPIQSFDGGRMLECTLLSVMDVKRASKILHAVSFLLLWLIWVLAVYLLIRAGDGLSLFCFSVSLMSRFFFR